MFVNKEGIFYNPVTVSDSARVVKSYMVRLIGCDVFRKEVVGEEPFDSIPSENQILYCLAKYPQANFAVVETIYKLENNEEWCGLPFN